jgi:hypothetical protein
MKKKLMTKEHAAKYGKLANVTEMSSEQFINQIMGKNPKNPL